MYIHRSGKSSMMIALFRIQDLAGGSIYIDGVDLATVPVQYLRGKLGKRDCYMLRVFLVISVFISYVLIILSIPACVECIMCIHITHTYSIPYIILYYIGIIPQDPVMFSASVRFNLDPFSEFSDSVS